MARRTHWFIWEGAGAHLDEVQLGCWVPGPHAEREGAPGPVDVIHAQHRGPQEARALHPLVVQHAEQRLGLGGEMLDLQGQLRAESIRGRPRPAQSLPTVGSRQLPTFPPAPAHPVPPQGLTGPWRLCMQNAGSYTRLYPPTDEEGCCLWGDLLLPPQASSPSLRPNQGL